MDRGSKSKAIYLGFLALYAEKVKKAEKRGEMTKSAFSRSGIFHDCALAWFQVHEHDAASLGVLGFEAFEAEIWRIFCLDMDWMRKGLERDQVKGQADVRPLIEKVEQMYRDQDISEQEKQVLWESEIDFYASTIVQSPSWDDLAGRIANSLRGLLRIDEPLDKVKADVWSLAWKHIRLETGPMRKKTQGSAKGTGRRINEVIDRNYIRDQYLSRSRKETPDVSDTFLMGRKIDDIAAPVRNQDTAGEISPEILHAILNHICEDDLDRSIVELYFNHTDEDPPTQAEIAKKLGVSQGTISNRRKKMKKRQKKRKNE